MLGNDIAYGTVYADKKGNQTIYYVYGKDMYGEEGWMKMNGYRGGDNGRYSKG